ncbi:MAG: MFS transporter [Pseudomonadota bacterium]
MTAQRTPAAPKTRAAIVAIAVSQTLVWAGLYYSFPALLLVWESEGWSRESLTLCFTLALLAATAASPVFGALVDRGLGRTGMLAATCLGAVSLAGLALAQSIAVFGLVWIVIGASMGGSLYETCFAQVTRTDGALARRRITAITLVAGFASTLSFPAAAHLAAAIGWRGAVLVGAGAILVLAVPLLWWGLGVLERHAAPLPPRVTRPTAASPVNSRAFWLLFLGFPCLALNHGILITHFLPLLAERGVAESAGLLAVSLIGPMQVAGRLAMVAAERRASAIGFALLACGAIAAASAVLMASGAWFFPLALFALLQGAAIGTTSILRPVIAAQFFGRSVFGIVSGWLAAPYIAATALAPVAGALLWRLGGYELVLAVTCSAALAALMLIAALPRPAAAAGNDPTAD